jgi:hypothetical protein
VAERIRIASGTKVEPKKDPEKILNAGALDSLISEAEDAEQNTRGFMEPQATVVKRKRGRPPKSETAQAAPDPQGQPAPAGPPPESILKPAFKTSFALTSVWLQRKAGDPRVCLLDGEIEELASAWAAVGDKYLPGIMSQYSEEIRATTATVMVGVRLNSIMSQILQERKAARKEWERHNRVNTPPPTQNPDPVINQETVQ